MCICVCVPVCVSVCVPVCVHGDSLLAGGHSKQLLDKVTEGLKQEQKQSKFLSFELRRLHACRDVATAKARVRTAAIALGGGVCM